MIPLSTRMRPSSLEDFQGQEHFLYPGSLLYNAIKNKTFDCAIFYGPSGTGKTTLARLIAREMDADFYEINASTSGTKELKEIIETCRGSLFGLEKKKPYVYVDEFHRWNKLQQDSLLRWLEEGVIRFIGSTTENPYFAVNNAVISRVRAMYEFHRLERKDILAILKRAMEDEERGLGRRKVPWDEEALVMIADRCGGDARMALDTLGFIADNLPEGGRIDLQMVSEATQSQAAFFDRSEDKYNLLSALQKSIRGSDPDAALHYLARLIAADADVQMIGRRLVVMASEDVGMAYPMAITIVTSCVQAALMTGFPEAQINLAQAVILLASSPKSNSVITGIGEAMADVKKKRIDDVPAHLKDAHYAGAKQQGRGLEYKYPHNYEGGFVEQQYLPDDLYRQGVQYYHPTDHGKEGAFKNYLEYLWKKKR